MKKRLLNIAIVLFLCILAASGWAAFFRKRDRMVTVVYEVLRKEYEHRPKEELIWEVFHLKRELYYLSRDLADHGGGGYNYNRPTKDTILQLRQCSKDELIGRMKSYLAMRFCAEAELTHLLERELAERTSNNVPEDIVANAPNPQD